MVLPLFKQNYLAEKNRTKRKNFFFWKNKLSSKQMTEHTRDAVVYRMDSFFGGEDKVN